MANDTLETIVHTKSNQNTSRDPTNNNTHVLETVQVIPNATFAKPFPDISKIKVFYGENFKRWQEHVYSVLDMHGVAFALTKSLSPTASGKQIECWIHANKESKEIWDNMILNYTAEDIGKQKFIIGKFYRWEMTEDVEKCVYLLYSSKGRGRISLSRDSRTTSVLGKGKVMLKLTSGKTLALSDVFYVHDIQTNLVSVALLGKAGIKISFQSDKVILFKSNNFVGKGYCKNGLFVLNVYEIMNANASSSSAYLIDSYDL
ncbi:hypothetical protein HRI_001269000 [Hibiscus trionum]|uniref:Retrovirus-related Pol polyprotein from transposon TNT 1-94-like beta-barrel domain-containing protein n=1 Tax=Hibiscus trionum TaxID=183268 RepID=A0A9W7HEJ0_HIBTR|nr:hypothetical protein HRI_001269000 [Hibiscus trionum]